MTNAPPPKIASPLLGVAWLVGAAIVAVGVACSVTPAVHVVPFAWERKVGTFLQSDAKRCTFTPQEQRIQKILLQRLFPIMPGDDAFTIDVRFVHDREVNAYAEFGGYITVNSGLLAQAQSPEELAGVLAHEIGHVHHRHLIEGSVVRLIFARIFAMGFTRLQESEADADGLQRLQAARVDNRGLARFFARAEHAGSQPAFFSDHPSSQERVSMTQQYANLHVRPIMPAREWELLKHACDTSDMKL